MPSPVTRHFDSIAQEYDYWKKKNRFYHRNLKLLLCSKIPAHARVVEIGCGTGDLLASLRPSQGLGIDISQEMISIAQAKHADKPELRFLATDVADISRPLEYDVLFMADVLEHLENIEGFFGHLERLIKPGSILVITIANPFWEPALMIAEKLRLKMPEGPHERLPLKATEKVFARHGFSVREKGSSLLCPIPLPFADLMNKLPEKLPFLKPLQFIKFWVLERI